ncbi:MAG: HepT-like ribonuclease domain-containing protein [Gemmatimonadales bacterium]
MVGEAAAGLSAAFRAAQPELPWVEMIGMRNRIVHGYDHVDPDMVWEVVVGDLEVVIAALDRILALE